MQSEIQQLSSFYDSPLGLIARRLILRQVRAVWPDLTNSRVLGYGFAVPYLKSFIGEAERVVALMPAQQGAIAWPGPRSLTALGEEDALPFPEAFFDRILIVHGLELAEAARPFLRQIWRALSSSGRVLLIVPNRASLWAQVERSPFAQGRPFNRGQLDQMLKECLFAPERWDSALMLPPLRARRLIRSGTRWERFGRSLWPRLAGVHLVEASKSLYALTPPAPAGKSRLVLAGSQV